MEFLFGRRKTPQELLRENQRALRKAIRELEREKVSLQNEEKKIIIEIKKLAKQGQTEAAKIMARDLVRTRNYVKKFTRMKTQLTAVSMKMQTLQSTQAMANAMKGATRAMVMMNKQLNMPQIQKIVMEFEKQSEMMDMKEEMMSDTIDDVMEGEGDEEETDAIVSQVLDEIGINLNSEFVSAPTELETAKGKKEANTEKGHTLAPVSAVSAGAGPSPSSADVDLELQARLENLRRN
eukprot:TRINITY_DN7599_c0_g1_i1.p1 TRINITY_DN7599_c0_g1~~TRINITY_DN7599_c0_g1_i1.p1  ORF type:complete len:256 (-),score=101.66 TRINITY_DN7599_c0_g1_i1:197-907(-)